MLGVLEGMKTDREMWKTRKLQRCAKWGLLLLAKGCGAEPENRAAHPDEERCPDGCRQRF
ncbi:MAG: hypothetical protein ACLURV_11260 [Gallintestinimicrobium sp.]